jgi:hypothetical protein
MSENKILINILKNIFVIILMLSIKKILVDAAERDERQFLLRDAARNAQ